jgi:SNF2 family DNA or RNA helicase
MILEREQGVVVPATINSRLREYQRDGVRFLWDKYQQERGGLLGDDMGLVRRVMPKIGHWN